jgi:hypothetical protein
MGENLKNYIDENKDKKMRFIEFEDERPSILGMYIHVYIYIYMQMCTHILLNTSCLHICMYLKIRLIEFIEFEDENPSILGMYIHVYVKMNGCIYIYEYVYVEHICRYQ